MGYKETYELWLASDVLSAEDKAELKSIANDEKEIEERFYRELEFGTAGMRGIIGIGTNRINIYNVRRASQGVAKYVTSAGEDAMKAGVLIGYDTRNYSKIFAVETAKVLAAAGIHVYIFPIVHSVPEVSFGIRELGCAAGVMITASHNPKQYNGYKVYGPDGGQLPPAAADVVVEAINSYDVFKDVKFITLDAAAENDLLTVLGPDLDNKFIETVMTQQQNPEVIPEVADDFKVIYTPFHGTGSRPIKAVLRRIGVKNLMVVKEQDTEDGNFPTVKSPNPEDKEGFEIAIDMAKKNDVDFIVGTDPDCDRVGIIVRDAEGIYRPLTGNQTGALLVDYILRSKQEKGTLPENGVVIKTIVTTELAAAIAQSYGMEIMNVLTGFKYIGEKMTEFAETGSHTYLIGFEESYGYLVGNHARDKDGVVATMLIVEMAAYYRKLGKSLYEALQDIYKKYGYYAERTVSFTMPGKDGMEKMAALLKDLRENPPTKMAGLDISLYTDYQSQTIKDTKGGVSPLTGLPKSNVLKYNLADDKTYFIVRPSGTEPKVKLYMGTFADSFESAEAIIDKVNADFKNQYELN
ncbi:MAG: phospho-sugar mutase [Clostridiales bacterium]|nr:phospho-sugar mutase [Clostridiales bacterium]